jgi:poly(hydroxyalkanoate) granule-associated protein
MVKKVDNAAGPPPGLLDSQLAQAVKESAQQIWLAGMGAFAKAQEGRLKVFEALIKEGTSLQRKTQSAAEEKIGEVTDRMSAMAGDVTAKAGQHWDKLESIFEQRTAKAMNKLGDELAAAVARLSKAAPAKVAARAPAQAAAKAPKKPPARAAAKKAGARKTRS